MKLHRWNGEYWYVDQRGVLSRIRKWFGWFGGWEAHKPRPERPDYLRKWTLRERLSPHMLAPVSLFGHRITYYSWGLNLRLRGRGHWVVTWGGGHVRCYFSHNGTPSEATVWLRGAPPEVTHAAEKREGGERSEIAAYRESLNWILGRLVGNRLKPRGNMRRYAEAIDDSIAEAGRVLGIELHWDEAPAALLSTENAADEIVSGDLAHELRQTADYLATNRR